jgi:hypothetical protein
MEVFTSVPLLQMAAVRPASQLSIVRAVWAHSCLFHTAAPRIQHWSAAYVEDVRCNGRRRAKWCSMGQPSPASAKPSVRSSGERNWGLSSREELLLSAILFEPRMVTSTPVDVDV